MASSSRWSSKGSSGWHCFRPRSPGAPRRARRRLVQGHGRGRPARCAIASVGAAIGFSLAAISRNTARRGRGFGYLVSVRADHRGTPAGWQKWLLIVNIGTFLTGDPQRWGSAAARPSAGICGERTRWPCWWWRRRSFEPGTSLARPERFAHGRRARPRSARPSAPCLGFRIIRAAAPARIAIARCVQIVSQGPIERRPPHGSRPSARDGSGAPAVAAAGPLGGRVRLDVLLTEVQSSR